MSAVYVPLDEPLQVGSYRGKPIMVFGYYKVTLGSFTYLSPHTATPGTVSEPPVDLKANPGFVDDLHWAARLAREQLTVDGECVDE
jgi:hypothetical protein